LRTKISQQAGAKRQKSRTLCIPQMLPCIPLGDAALVFAHNFRFDLVYLKLTRRTLKRSVR